MRDNIDSRNVSCLVTAAAFLEARKALIDATQLRSITTYGYRQREYCYIANSTVYMHVAIVVALATM